MDINSSDFGSIDFNFSLDTPVEENTETTNQTAGSGTEENTSGFDFAGLDALGFGSDLNLDSIEEDTTAQTSIYSNQEFEVNRIHLQLKKKSVNLYYTIDSDVAKTFFKESSLVGKFNDKGTIYILPYGEPINNTELLHRLSIKSNDTVSISPNDMMRETEDNKFESNVLYEHLTLAVS